jgi:hypothetical protein
LVKQIVARSLEIMKMPSDMNLPYFAYGLFKPNEPAHSAISQYLTEKPKPWTINDIGFWIRDGLPVVDLNRPGQNTFHNLYLIWCID